MAKIIDHLSQGEILAQMAEEKKVTRLVDVGELEADLKKKTSQKRRPRARLPTSCSARASKMSCLTSKTSLPLTLRACDLRQSGLLCGAWQMVRSASAGSADAKRFLQRSTGTRNMPITAAAGAKWKKRMKARYAKNDDDTV